MLFGLMEIAAVEKEFVAKVKKFSQRYANFELYLQGNRHLGWMFPVNAGTE